MFLLKRDNNSTWVWDITEVSSETFSREKHLRSFPIETLKRFHFICDLSLCEWNEYFRFVCVFEWKVSVWEDYTHLAGYLKIVLPQRETERRNRNSYQRESSQRYIHTAAMATEHSKEFWWEIRREKERGREGWQGRQFVTWTAWASKPDCSTHTHTQSSCFLDHSTEKHCCICSVTVDTSARCVRKWFLLGLSTQTYLECSLFLWGRNSGKEGKKRESLCLLAVASSSIWQNLPVVTPWHL